MSDVVPPASTRIERWRRRLAISAPEYAWPVAAAVASLLSRLRDAYARPRTTEATGSGLSHGVPGASQIVRTKDGHTIWLQDTYRMGSHSAHGRR